MRLVLDHTIGVVTVYQEAEGESLDGKTAVAEVILRRTARKFMSDGTVIGTCLKPMQFSGWNAAAVNRIRSLKIDDTDPIVQDCLKAWDRAVAGSTLTDDAVLYLNPKGVAALPQWANPDHYVCSIGSHDFYRAI